MTEEPEYRQRAKWRVETLRQTLEQSLPAGEQLTLELGCGHGHYLSAYATAHPSEQCLGLDLITKRIEKANAKAEKRSLPNLCFLKAEASECLEALPPSLSLAKIFMLFPDPWPKKRHFKNRMIQDGFLTELAKRCSLGAPFFFRTDHTGLFEWARTHLGAHPNWTIDESALWPFEQSSFFQEKMESWQSFIAHRL